MKPPSITRRAFLGGALAGAGALGAAKLASAARHVGGAQHLVAGHGANRIVGDVRTDDFDPYAYLTSFDGGRVSTMGDGRLLREYDLTAKDFSVEIAPGVSTTVWGLNDQVPGPTIRATEGDLVRINFVNGGTHPHTLHFHGFHAPEMDGVPGIGAGEIPPGGRTVYEFEAEPFGCHLYHCHATPLKRHIAKGLYGVYIVDPKGGRPPANEMVMMMNAFDTDFDGENEFYAVNTKPFAYIQRPIRVRRDELQRVYLVNITEFDPVNSMHLHANFFDYYPTGTKLEPTEFTDTKMLCQGERGILEFRYNKPGMFMFHAHQSEFAELGWSGMFEVVP